MNSRDAGDDRANRLPPPAGEDFIEFQKALSALTALLMRARSDDPDAGMMSVLSAVLAHGPLRSTVVAQRVYLDASTVSRHVQSLERAGFVVRSVDDQDRRAAKLQATPAGAAQLEHMWGRRVRLLRDGLSHWAPADLRLLTVLVRRFVGDAATADRPPEH